MAGRFLDGGMSLFGCVPVRIVPAGGSWTGLNQGKLGVRRLTGDFVIFCVKREITKAYLELSCARLKFLGADRCYLCSIYSIW